MQAEPPEGVHVRHAAEPEFPALARMWHESWHDAHDAHVPAALVALRTYDSFLVRLAEFGDRLRVAGPWGAPNGICVINHDEIDQLFVAREARGRGVAAALLADGEARLRDSGIALARLDVAIENTRAIRFYEKHGWEREEIRTVTLNGPFDLRVLVLTKSLA
jgi:ribosomal protein S18 acetylase RimI-like enzyme